MNAETSSASDDYKSSKSKNICSQKPTVATYIVQRLEELGIRNVFGLPGDYSFPLDDAFEASQLISWVACANELNAGYAADGYARAHGAAILCTTYGVGELSALNAVMGAKAERVPIFHIVGAPSKRVQRTHRPMHHSLGDGEFDQFFPLSAAAACASAVLTPENVILEMDRVIHEVFSQRRPAYLLVPADYALMEVVGDTTLPRKGVRVGVLGSQPQELRAALDLLLKRIAAATAPVLLPAFTVGRYQLQDKLEEFLLYSGIPYATTMMDKGVLSESHPNYLGMYVGAASHPEVKERVESADLIINFGGVLFTDISTMFFSEQLHHADMITVWPDYMECGENLSMLASQSKTYGPVAMSDLLEGLLEEYSPVLKKQNSIIPSKAASQEDEKLGAPQEPVTMGSFASRLQQFLKPEDQLIVEAGLCMFPMASLLLPKNVSYFNQALWCSVGWATGALLGVALAHQKRRAILVTGDGAHQCSANELGTMGRYGLKPIIFLLNDGIYATEEFLEKKKGHAYNLLTPWAYHKLPETMGCRHWFTAQVHNNEQLNEALAKVPQTDTACYLEIFLQPAATPSPLALIESLNQTLPPI